VNIHFSTLEACTAATGTVVVIDVWRSFTTAACAFARGARDIIAVGSTEQALALRDRFPDALLTGRGLSVVGPPAEGFDFDNSPTAMMNSEVDNRRLVQCTPNGTRGIVRCEKAESLLGSSFICAGATVRYIKQQSPTEVTFVGTGTEGEDQACGEYMAKLLLGEEVDVTTELDRIRQVGLERARTMIDKGLITEVQGMRLNSDLDWCLSLDRFDFAMLVERRGGFLVMRAIFSREGT
jgi:2-phosphosulfolactate phosphatase